MFLVNYTCEGKTEECTVRKTTLETDKHCSHCGNVINKGDITFILCSEEERLYVLDETCFQTKCIQKGTVWNEEDESVFQDILGNILIAEANAILAEAKADSICKHIELPAEVKNLTWKEVLENHRR